MKSEIKIGDNRLEMTRIFDVPRERVFDAWKQSAKLQQWWGCSMTTRVEPGIDFRVGGLFTHKMQIDGVGEMVYTGAYHEIIEPEEVACHAEFGGTTIRVEGFSAAFDRLEQVLSGQLARAV